MVDYNLERENRFKELFMKAVRKEKLTDSELQELYEEGDGDYLIDTYYSNELSRWSRSCIEYYKYNDIILAVYKEEGLTENQESWYPYQPDIVIQKTRMVEEKYYEVVE
jgi:hypothetical protein